MEILYLLPLFLLLGNCTLYTQIPTKTKAHIFKEILNDLKQNQNPEVLKLLQDAEQKAENLENQTDLKIKTLEKNAFIEAKQINEKLEKDIEKITESAGESIKNIKDIAHRGTKELSDESSKEINNINENIKTEVGEFKKNATLKILEVIDNADEEALKYRKSQRQKSTLENLQQSLNQIPSVELFNTTNLSFNFEPVTENWKTTVIKEFDANSALLQQIVLDAENHDQITDFINRFEQQKIWFDKTLRSTKYISDPNYNKIVDKNVHLDKITTSIKKSDAILVPLELSTEQKKQIRLRVLYDINSMQVKNSLSDEQIKLITIKAIEDISGKKAGAIPELNLTKFTYAKKFEDFSKDMFDLQITNKELLNKIDENQKTTSELKTIFSEYKVQNKETTNKINLVEQICDTTVNEEKNIFINKLEHKNRQKLNMDIEALESTNKNLLN